MSAEALAVMNEGFWKDPGCHVAGGGLAQIERSGGSVVFATSGSTGTPKWIVLSKDAILHSARAVNEWLGVDSGSVWGLPLPLGHVGGFGVVARAYAAGCKLQVFEGKWDARRFAEWIRTEGVTHASLVPTQVHDLLAVAAEGGESLRAVVVGGGRLSDEVGQKARDAGWQVLASYGMTEAGSQVATQRLDGLNMRFADCPLELLPIWGVKVTDEGLLRLRGDALFCGTIERGMFRPRQGDWFTTSDRVKISGREVSPLGRADSMVKVLGELVDVDVVERRFREFCAGRGIDCGLAIVAVPDKRREHALVAVFEGTDVPGIAEEYNSQAKGLERIAGSCAVPVLPRSPLGKLLRAELGETIPSTWR